VRTRKSQGNIVALWDIHDVRQRASSHFGPLNPGSTTLLAQEIHRAYQEARLMELLNSLESVVQELNYKSFTAYDTLNTAMEDLRAVLLPSTNDTDGTND